MYFISIILSNIPIFIIIFSIIFNNENDLVLFLIFNFVTGHVGDQLIQVATAKNRAITLNIFPAKFLATKGLRTMFDKKMPRVITFKIGTTVEFLSSSFLRALFVRKLRSLMCAVFQIQSSMTLNSVQIFRKNVNTCRHYTFDWLVEH